MEQNSTEFIQVRGLGLQTPSGPVYRDVNLSVGRQQLVALFGSEGCGKTCLMLTLAARMRFMQGSATVAGFDLRKQHNKVRAVSNITLVARANDITENSRIEDILAAELQVVGKSGRRAKVAEYLEHWNLAELSGRRFRDLDSYDRKRFDIALAFAGDPQLLMVDDIQNGLTQHQSIRLMKALKELTRAKGTTIMVGMNEYEVARYADAVVVCSQEAEEQRQAVLAARGDAFPCPVCGTANGVELLDEQQPSPIQAEVQEQEALA